MASISIKGWIAEGGCQIYQGRKNKVLVFDVVEEEESYGGIESIDDYNTNHAWFHCSLENALEDSAKLTIIPLGYTLKDVGWKGYATICKEDDKWSIIPNEPRITAEQIADYIVEGKWVYLNGNEVLVRGENGKLIRLVKVTHISFDDWFEVKKPKLLSVPYKSTMFIETRL